MGDKFLKWFDGLSDGAKVYGLGLSIYLVGLATGCIFMYGYPKKYKRLEALEPFLEYSAERENNRTAEKFKKSTPPRSLLYILCHLETVDSDAVNPDSVRSDVGIDHTACQETRCKTYVIRGEFDFLESVGDEYLKKLAASDRKKSDDAPQS